jgi:putative (di)nucleoside polyphosphate hydrolase
MSDEILEKYRPCVGLVIQNDKGQVFAGKRFDNQTSHAWQMPQGGIDVGETPTQAALRELEEETGILENYVKLITRTQDWLTYDLPEHISSNLWGGRYIGQKQLWFVFRFTGTDDHININTKHPEFSEWAWLYPDEIKRLTVPFKLEIYNTVFKLLDEPLS